MVTRRAAGVLRPQVLSAAAIEPQISPVPSSVRDALADPHWRRVMEEEYAVLLANQTWDLIATRLAGFTQRPGVDYDETLSPMMKPATVRTVLSLALSCSWPVHQLDVKNAFLHGILTKTVYCSQPAGFVDPAHPEMVCRLNKSLYGLKQAPWAWYHRFAMFLAKLSEDAGDPVADPTAYQSLAGALQYLTFTRPDITYAVQQVCLHMHDPREPHLTPLKQLLRYLRGTVNYGLLLHRSSSTKLVVYTDAD
ncbi:hypothetical protein U9M48_005264 [Paspalum notatum var. saurae]|uniref:Reverse transcriptase Ty1/copia-type domain-containing protein n=1 Tax=Paspalum notatum var. saurae TaxID=547442 RepID=A0AAQ3PLY5_PASNO